MKRQWETEELIEHWTLNVEELALLGNKTGATRLGFAVLLKFFQKEARFPAYKNEVPGVVITYLATQARVPPEAYLQYDWQGRSIKEHRAQIREAVGFREATVADGEEVKTWLVEQVLPQEHQEERLREVVYQRYRDLKIEAPTPNRILRQIRSARHTFEQQFYETTAAKLPAATRVALEQLLLQEVNGEAEAAQVTLLDLRQDPGRVGLNTMLEEIAKLRRIRELAIPSDLFAGIARKVLSVYRNRAGIEEPSRLRAHAEPMRLTLLAALCTLRGQEITDALVELLIQLVHRIIKRAEERVETEYINELKRLAGKDRLLYQIAGAAVQHPDGLVREVIYPVAPEVPSEEEIQRFYEAVWKARKFADMVLIKTLFYTGARISELVNMRLSDVDLERCQIRINQGKGDNDRIVPFPLAFRELLGMHMQHMRQRSATYIFESSRRRKYSDRGVRKMLARYAAAAGITRSMSPHKWRHFLFTWLKKQGIDDALIQPYSGHESRESLEIYSRLSIAEAQKEYDQVMGKFPIQ